MSDSKRKVDEIENDTDHQDKRTKTGNGNTDTERDPDDSIDNHDEDEAEPEKNNKVKKPQIGGELLIAGGTNWDLVGRKSLPKGVKNIGGPNLWGLHRVASLEGKKICMLSSGCVAVHSVVIDEEGQAYTWGRNDSGQLGQGNTRRLDKPTILKTLSSTSVIHVACGKAHTLFLTEQGRVYSCGENKLGQLGLGDQSNTVLVPTKINHNSAPICRVACGAEFSMFVDIRGNLFSFGLPEYGQLGHNCDGKYFVTSNKVAYHCETRPRKVSVYISKGRDNHVTPVIDVEVKEVTCGVNHTVIIDTKGRVFTWGFGGYGRLGHNAPKDEMVPRQIQMFEGPNRSAVSVGAGSSYTIFVTESGMFYMCGINKSSGEAAMYPKMLQDLAGWKTRSIHCCFRSIALAADDSLVAWGPSPTYGELAYGEDDSKSSTIPKESKTYGAYIEKVGGGYGHLLAIARTETEEDREALKKIPMYKPDVST